MRWQPRLFVLFISLTLPALAQDRGFSNERSIPHGTRDRTYDIQHLKLDIAFDHAEGLVMGKATTTLTPINDGLVRIVLDAVDLSIGSVSLAMDVTIEASSREGNRPLIYAVENGQLIIDLDKPYSSGESITLQVTYHAQPRLGLYFVRPDEAYPTKPWQIWSQGEMEENRYWFPCYDSPNDLMTTEMIVTVPDSLMAISNGELVEIRRNEHERTITYHWRENIPHVTYLVSVIVGRFLEVRDEWNGIPILYYVEHRDSSKVERSFARTPDMIDFFSKMIGIRYPYEKYAQTTITDFMWGGMENISATTLMKETLHDERAGLDVSSDGLVAHELVHQWWGDLLTTKNWNHIWLNEAFATYFEALYVEYDKGPREFILELETNRQAYFKEDAYQYRRPIVTNRYENPEQMFDRHTYEKGSLVLHMLRNLLGNELWWKAIRHYARTYAGQAVETNDFKQAIEDATGRSLEWFFDQWVYHGGHPEYDVSWGWDRRKQAVALEVKQVQGVGVVTPLFRMPIEVAVTGDSSTEIFTIQVDKAEEIFYLPVPAKPLRVEFDPDGQVLKELTFKKHRKEVLNQLVNAGDVGRMRAAQWLGIYDYRDITEALGTALRQDPFRGVRGAAAWALGEIKTKAARDALLLGLQDEHAHVRRAAVTALGNYVDDSQVAVALENVFRSDSSYYARAEAVKSITRLGAIDAYDICLEALGVASYKEVIRCAALSGLVTLKDPRGVDHALALAEYGQPFQVRVEAVSAMAGLGVHIPKRKKEIRERLIALLEDPHFRVKTAVIRALGQLGDPKALKALEESLEREPHFRHREAAREVIREIRIKGER
ncbi:MAG: HEAT repeat domain-containing protein [Fidelibacterota bacterium]|nr:MAG: HEAT repeat domain-containing protein [Candidatus Neomarinimicrobiota bacterium]